jgi:phosphoribosylglycinamide formyltransferase-1
MKRIAIFASGTGTNAENIVRYFSGHKHIYVHMAFVNKKKVQVVERMVNNHVPVVFFDRHTFYETDYILELLLMNQIDMIVLAGFLWLFPVPVINAYEGKIVNIHPALLPKYGGKGMYGMKVHECVCENRETESGITIHYINEEYDKGEHILQKKCSLDESDTPEIIAKKVHQLEYDYFPKVIEDLLMNS